MLRKGIVIGTAVVLLAGCSGDQPEPTGYEIRTPLYARGGNAAFNMGTHMTGDEEVFTPAVSGGLTPAASAAQGQAIFRVSDDGSTVDFRLIASNIDNVIMAHIHCAPPGFNGQIRMWLHPVIGTSGTPTAPNLGRFAGVLAAGTFSPAGVTCPANNGNAVMPLLEAMRRGLTYVNVHTRDGAGLENTAPGDFMAGELRGQID